MSHRPEPVCRNNECPCAIPGPVCEEWLACFTEYCIRCGWEERDHKRRPSLIHNGKKPR